MNNKFSFIRKSKYDYRIHDLECSERSEKPEQRNINDKKSLNSKRKKSFVIIPNPNSGIFQLTFNNEKIVRNISVFNTLGHQVFRTNNITDQIRLDHVRSGIYYIKVTYDDASFELQNMSVY